VRPPGRALDLEEWTAVLDQLEALGCQALWLTGGEPTAWPPFWTLLERARARPWQIVILTNGTLLGEREVRRLAQIGPDVVQLTLFSLDAGIHDALAARPGAHRRTLAAIDRLQARGVPLRIKVPLVRSNLPGVEAIERWARARDIPLLTSLKVFPGMDGDPCALQHAVTDPGVIRARLGRCPDYNEASDPGGSRLPCRAGRSFLAIGASGVVYPCTCFPAAMGDVRERPLRAIWADSPSPVTTQLRATTKADMERIPSCSAELCPRCPGIAAALGHHWTRAVPFACQQCSHQDGGGRGWRAEGC